MASECTRAACPHAGPQHASPAAQQASSSAPWKACYRCCCCGGCVPSQFGVHQASPAAGCRPVAAWRRRDSLLQWLLLLVVPWRRLRRPLLLLLALLLARSWRWLLRRQRRRCLPAPAALRCSRACRTGWEQAVAIAPVYKQVRNRSALLLGPGQRRRQRLHGARRELLLMAGQLQLLSGLGLQPGTCGRSTTARIGGSAASGGSSHRRCQSGLAQL